MAGDVSKLETALAAVEDAIENYDPTAPETYNLEGLSVKRKTLDQLLKDRDGLVKAIADSSGDAGGLYEEVSYGLI